MIKKYLTIITLAIILFACNKPAGELVGVSSKMSVQGFSENNPFGMVFIKRGSFIMGTNEQSAFGLTNDKPINVTVDAFWMDETEITNDEYKQFVVWVRDSIARRMLVMQLNDDEAIKFLSSKYKDSTLTPEIKAKGRLNWNAKIPWGSKEPEVIAVLSQLYEIGANEKRSIDTKRLRYEYEWINYEQLSLLRNKYDVNTGTYKDGAFVWKDSSWVEYTDLQKKGIIRDTTVRRFLSTKKDLISNRILNIYPDTVVWTNDFQNSLNDPKLELYFCDPIFSNYPVVGVTWNQATAFCNWRTELFNSHNKSKGQAYRLPTEAEWEYAARGGRQLAMYPWGGNYLRDSRGCYLANFKPMRGGYTDDTGATTMKVASFLPNDFGLFDMAGNVAEWTSSAYVSSSNTLVADMNPNFQYNAKNKDPNVLKRKVVKGGSWKDVGYYLQCGAKTYEYQSERHSYIGFRCVRSYKGN